MKKSLIALAAFCFVGAASASGIGFGNTDNRDYSTTNQGGAGGQGGKGGEGGSAVAGAVSGAAALAGAVSGASSDSRSTATGGNASSISGGNSVSSSTTILGDAAQESNTPPVVAGNIPAVPTSCRLYLFGGGATRDGAASGSIPLGNDETCLSIAKLNLMERAGGFTQPEKQAVVCKVEGMAELSTCKALAK